MRPASPCCWCWVLHSETKASTCGSFLHVRYCDLWIIQHFGGHQSPLCLYDCIGAKTTAPTVQQAEYWVTVREQAALMHSQQQLKNHWCRTWRAFGFQVCFCTAKRIQLFFSTVTFDCKLKYVIPPFPITCFFSIIFYGRHPKLLLTLCIRQNYSYKGLVCH